MNWELDDEHRDFQAVRRRVPAPGDRACPASGRRSVPRSVAMAKYRTARIGGGAGEMQLEILSRELTP